MQIQDIGVAARNLADYIDVKGEGADVQIVIAQVGLMVGHVTELEDQRGSKLTNG